MKNRTVFILVLVALFAILLIQNSGMAPLRFYFWSIYAPQFILVFFVFLIGFLAGFLAARGGRKKDRGPEPHEKARSSSPAPPKIQS